MKWLFFQTARYVLEVTFKYDVLLGMLLSQYPVLHVLRTWQCQTVLLKMCLIRKKTDFISSFQKERLLLGYLCFHSAVMEVSYSWLWKEVCYPSFSPCLCIDIYFLQQAAARDNHIIWSVQRFPACASVDGGFLWLQAFTVRSPKPGGAATSSTEE